MRILHQYTKSKVKMFNNKKNVKVTQNETGTVR